MNNRKYLLTYTDSFSALAGVIRLIKYNRTTRVREDTTNLLCVANENKWWGNVTVNTTVPLGVDFLYCIDSSGAYVDGEIYSTSTAFKLLIDAM